MDCKTKEMVNAPRDEASGEGAPGRGLRPRGWRLGPEIGGDQTWARCLSSEGVWRLTLREAAESS